jgi:hypothetical protein
MTQIKYRVTTLGGLFLTILVMAPLLAFGQGRTLPEEDWYGETKRALANHYTGKVVRLKLPIPATRRGLEIIDGEIQNNAAVNPPPVAAELGEELTVKSFKITDNDIEMLLGKNEPPQPKKRFSNPFSGSKSPRINLHFSRELGAKDLTIENINRYLASAIDVVSLAPPVAEKTVEKPLEKTLPATQASLNTHPNEPPVRADVPARLDVGMNNQGLPTSTVVTELPSVGLNVAELTVETTAQPARVYIDGSYSGQAPRTVRLRAGVHTILVVSEGYQPWEQKLFIPGAKVSVVKAEVKR